ncbi:TerB family tellurite resistance protein [Nannocystis sp. SCPEA4]|uniref:TerB family tellurite resistance protein n=1 Tax=Nannocystis sp. SCPEA4 TaxID=2996787 RepID=UPI0022717F6F|nr:TerB family tellurite resistance protein [Nannocystis sp. SCPEA4]MCY1062777.1 TerB family tellurite resistance protein [Nannocystis sp. SCPEA4]
MDSRNLSFLLDIAQKVHEAHKQHHRLDISVAQQTDDLGIGLQIDLHAAIPAGALIFGRISGFWLGALSAVDDTLFRDKNGNFLTIGPVHGQRASLYIPYGAACNRGPGLYTLDLSIHLIDAATATSTEIGQASYKLALSSQPPWRRVEFFWPLIKLCMAVIRVDDEVVASEIRGLRESFTTHLFLGPADMPDLRAVMKDPQHGDLNRLLDSIALRMPFMGPETIVQLMCEIARLDGPVNVHEFGLIRQVAASLAVSPARCAELAAAPVAIAAPGNTRALAPTPR